MSTSSLCIINFHGIGIPHGDVGFDEAPYWLSQDRFRRILDQIQEHQEQGQRVKITFDDGNRSDIEIAVPELRARGLTGHFFVLAGRCNNPRYLSYMDIRELAESEMALGLHGKDHLDWRKLDLDRFSEEIINAREVLVGITGTIIDSVAIPFGSYSRHVVSGLKRAGYREIYTSDGGHTSEKYRLRHRTSVRADMTDLMIDSVLAGQESVTCKLQRKLKAYIKEFAI